MFREMLSRFSTDAYLEQEVKRRTTIEQAIEMNATSEMRFLLDCIDVERFFGVGCLVDQSHRKR